MNVYISFVHIGYGNVDCYLVEEETNRLKIDSTWSMTDLSKAALSDMWERRAEEEAQINIIALNPHSRKDIWNQRAFWHHSH